jgi:GDP-L-fucose synthase
MYGAYDHFDLVNSHVIPALINKFVAAKETNAPQVKCWGTGNATREFLAARDCAQAIVKAITTNFDYPDPINLGVGKDISIRNLACLIRELVGYQGDIVFDGTVGDGQPKRMLDVSRSNQLLGWTAETDLETGLKETIAWYLANRDQL